MSVSWVLPSYRSTLTICTICTCTTNCTYTKCWVLPGAPHYLANTKSLCVPAKQWVADAQDCQTLCLCVQHMCLEFETFCVQGIPWIGNFIVSARTGLALMNPLKDLRIAKSKGAIWNKNFAVFHNSLGSLSAVWSNIYSTWQLPLSFVFFFVSLYLCCVCSVIQDIQHMATACVPVCVLHIVLA